MDKPAMSRFRPTRVSPPIKPIVLPSAGAQPLDVSRSSNHTATELMGLAGDDVEFLDAVIERAGPSATTFLTVFKAYNDILHERGLDPQNEVVYYGKLLKLGTLKGKNWGDKWREVKLLQGFDVSPSTALELDSSVILQAPKKNLRPVVSQGDESFTLHSQEDHSEFAGSDSGTSAEFDVLHDTKLPRPTAIRPPSSQTTSSIRYEHGIMRPPHLITQLPHLQTHSAPLLPVKAKRITAWDLEASEPADDHATPLSATPPSYRTTLSEAEKELDSQPHKSLFPRLHTHGELPLRTTTVTPSAHARQLVAQARERRGSVINEDEAWNKIKMQRDEQEADKFRDEKLLERCWEVWKQGVQWIITTNEQIDQARDTLLIRLSIHRWRGLLASRMELYYGVAVLSSNRLLRDSLSIWKERLREKRQIQWRQDMRLRMKKVREKREGKLRKDAWAKWRQSYQSHLSGQHYSERLLHRSVWRWRNKLIAMDGLEVMADQFLASTESRHVQRYWHLWKKMADIADTEKAVSEKVTRRIMREAIHTWRMHMRDHCNADKFYNQLVKKCVLRSWKAAKDRILSLEKRAQKHLKRQEDVLVRAVLRVWKARERGILLERVKAVRFINNYWGVWKERMQRQKQREDLALAFSTRTQTYITKSAFGIWRRVLSSHKDALAFAVHYDSAQTRFKMLLTWRIQLRTNVKRIKQARAAEKFFLTRKVWNLWHKSLDRRKLEKRVSGFEMRQSHKYFHRWIQHARRRQERKRAEIELINLVRIRILGGALRLWMNRVIEFKIREYDVKKRYEKNLQATALRKMKNICIRHVEELSLMESYQDVKREENIRRIFHRWLSAARASRYRRVILQQKEDEMKRASIAVAWDKWRDRYNYAKLKPIEHDAVRQRQKNLLYRAFGLWHAKTRSLPAIRFYATYTKANAWEIWRRAMPRALQAKKARELDHIRVLSKALDKWLQIHRTKIALKAVARARYLRLPTAAPRQPFLASKTVPVPPPVLSRTLFPRRNVRAEETEDETDTSPSDPHTQPLGTRTSIASLLSPRPRREVSPTRSKLSSHGRPDTSTVISESSHRRDLHGRTTRDSSPTRPSRPPSQAADEGGRSRLWMELRGVQRTRKPTSEMSGP